MILPYLTRVGSNFECHDLPYYPLVNLSYFAREDSSFSSRFFWPRLVHHMVTCGLGTGEKGDFGPITRPISPDASKGMAMAGERTDGK